jgi:nucleotide-binding universal stress UspA family protein
MFDMTAAATLVALALAWASIGILTGLLMARRGHSWFAWTLLGVVLGPLVVPLVFFELRHYGDVYGRLVAPGLPGVGSVDVLVGIDGSPQSLAAVRAVIRVVGSRLGRLTLAAVMEHGYRTTPAGSEDEKLARAHLAAAASSVGAVSAQTVLLQGRPADALTVYADREGYDMMAIGSRGRGASKALLGSVASRLAQQSPTPVLIVSEAERKKVKPSEAIA